MRGTIEKVKQGSAQDGSVWKSYTINGQQYSTFKFLDFQEGQELEFEFVQKGKYKNLAKAEVVKGGQTSNKDELIIREVAIKAAAEAVGSVGYDSQPSVKNIAEDMIYLAKEFEEYIKGESEGPPVDDDTPPF